MPPVGVWLLWEGNLGTVTQEGLNSAPSQSSVVCDCVYANDRLSMGFIRNPLLGPSVD